MENKTKYVISVCVCVCDKIMRLTENHGSSTDENKPLKCEDCVCKQGAVHALYCTLVQFWLLFLFLLFAFTVLFSFVCIFVFLKIAEIEALKQENSKLKAGRCILSL